MHEASELMLGNEDLFLFNREHTNSKLVGINCTCS